MKKKVIIQVASWLLSLAILAALVLWLDVPELGRRLMGANPWAIAGIVVLIVALIAVKGVRWWIMVDDRARAPLGTCVRLAFVAMFLNAFIPLRGGDVARGLLLARETGLGRARALGTVALDKLFDMLGIVVIVAPLMFLGRLPDWIRWPPVATVSAAVVLLATGVVLRVRMRRSGRDLASSGWLARTLAGFAAGFDSTLRARPAIACVALSLVQWTILVGTVVLSLLAVGIDPDPGTSLICLLAVQFAAGVPLTPSSAGTMHGAIVAVLVAVGVDGETAMGAAVVYHAAQTLPILVLGVVLARGTVVDLPAGADGASRSTEAT